MDTTSTVLQLHLRGHSWTTLTRFCIFMTTYSPSVLLLVPQKSNEYQYLKCTTISILILNVGQYYGQYQYPVKYWSIFKYQYQYFFLKHTLLLTFNMYICKKQVFDFHFLKWPCLAAWWSGVISTTAQRLTPSSSATL